MVRPIFEAPPVREVEARFLGPPGVDRQDAALDEFQGAAVNLADHQWIARVVRSAVGRAKVAQPETAAAGMREQLAH